MKLQDAIRLINHPDLSTSTPTTWADFGSGSGLFTKALGSLLVPGSKIYAIDKKPGAFSTDIIRGVSFETVTTDFTTNALPISDLDGIMMANSLHFVSDKTDFLHKCKKYFRAREVFVIVEYNTDRSNPWVPYPVSFESLRHLFLSVGFGSVEKVGEMSSRYYGNIYASIIKR